MIPLIGEKIPSVREIISCKGAKIPNYIKVQTFRTLQ
jgi:hypothetical protein